MKYFVWKKRFVALISNCIFLNAIFISFIIFLVRQEASFTVRFTFSAILIVFNILFFLMIRFEGSIIIFEDNEIKCTFLKCVRRTIPYMEIQDYGVFSCATIFQGRDKFIYISRFVLSEEQRGAEAYRLYKKTKNVLVLKYNAEALSLLRSKCHDIIPHINDAS